MTPDQMHRNREKGHRAAAKPLRASTRRIALALIDRHMHCRHMAIATSHRTPLERANWDEKADRTMADLRALIATGTLPSFIGTHEVIP